MPNKKSLSVMAQTLWPMLKLSSNRQKNIQTRQTDRQGKTMLSRGHKKPDYGHIILSTYTPNADKHVYAVRCLKYYLLGSEIVRINFKFCKHMDRKLPVCFEITTIS